MIPLRTWLVLPLLMPTAGNSLEPCTGGDDGYRQRFEELVAESIPEDFVFAADVFPAFDGEWSVRVVRYEDGFRVKLVQFEKSLWYAAHSTVGDTVKREFSGTTVGTSIHAAPVSSDFVAKLEVEWQFSIANIVEPYVLGFDGVSYRLRLPDDKCGKTWSPVPLHRDFLLVGIIDRLRDIALRESGRPDAEVEAVVSKVLDELRQMR